MLVKFYFIFAACALTLFISVPAKAVNHIVPFVQYFDCMRSAFRPKGDVFMKVQNKSGKFFSPARTYTQGINIDLILAESNQIVGFKFQNRDSPITLEDLKAGVQFGILKKTFHTIELDSDFNSETGGTLIMGTMAEISGSDILSVVRAKSDATGETGADLKKAQADYPTLGLSEKLAKHYQLDRKKPNKWIQERFSLKKIDGKWILKNSQGKDVDTIFVEMKTLHPYVPIVLGLSKIVSASTNSKPSCPLKETDNAALNESEIQCDTLQKQDNTNSNKTECNRD